jgi:tripartite-type tricarboxylate transporter receptor subunit TctC
MQAGFLRRHCGRAGMTAVAVTIALSFTAPATAQNAAANFPNRPVKIVVPFPAGGPTDINARIIAQKLSEAWGQGVVVENRPGGNTGIAAAMVAKAPADGYTILAAMDTTLVMNPASGASMSYDPFKDFAPITLTAKNTSLLTVRADGPKDIKELIELGKKSGKKLTFGAGITITRLAGLEFAKAAGIEVVLVPYKGSSEVVHGLLTGSVDFIVDGMAASLPLIQSGKLRALAKLNDKQLTSLPDLKLLSVAAGLPQIPEMSSWIGFVAPAGTPPEIVAKIQDGVVKAYADPAVSAKLDRAGINAVTTTPAEFDKFFRDEATHWTKVFKESGIKF